MAVALRSDVSFESGGERCAAWWYRPADEPPYPCVILAHGFGALKEARLWAYAERFAEAGLAALVFDYRHFGASEGEPRQLLDIKRQLADWSAALAYARAREDVDDRRVGLWGSSFSGGHVIVTAGRHPAEVRAVVSQVPFVDGVATVLPLGPRQILRLTANALRDQLGALTGRPPHTVPSVGPPGTLAAMTTPDAEPGYSAMFEPGFEWENGFAARLFLRIPSYRPLKHAADVRCPLLVVVGDEDAITPPRPAIKAAERAPHGELRRHPVGHFDVYRGDWFERVVAEETEFLKQHLGGQPERS